MERELLAKLYLKYQPMVSEYVNSIVHDPHDAEDVIQDVGVTILSKANPPASEKEFPGWCRGVARNTALHLWRRQRKAKMVFDDRLLNVIDKAYEEADAEDDLWADRRRAMIECLKEIPDRSRNLIEMKYFQGQSSSEIAGSLEKDAGAVRVALSRILALLGKCIDKHVKGVEA